jgi:ribosomal protein L28
MTNPARSERRCEQCGREGVRGFRTIPAVFVDWLQGRGVEPFWNPPITVCAAEKACRRRWPPSLERID